MNKDVQNAEVNCNKELDEQKQVAYYAALVQAWVGSKMEFDRSLLTLSAGGIGLLITLLSTVGVDGRIQSVTSVAALALFIACIMLVLTTFDLNGHYITSLAKGNKSEAEKYDKKLETIDLWAKRTFRLGVFMASIYGLLVAFKSPTPTKENKMFEDTKNEERESLSNGEGIEKSLRGIDSMQESLRGMNMLRPVTPDTSIHSLQGMNTLEPPSGQTAPPISGQQSGNSSEPKETK